MPLFVHPEFDAHEQVVHWHDRDAGLRAIIAVHDTTRGPALGGCRMWAYPSEREALTDVLRLSRGMTYKSALAGLPLGGGKSVIIGDPRTGKTPAVIAAMGRAVDSLGGRYIAAEDSGTGVADLQHMSAVTRHVAGIVATGGPAGEGRGDEEAVGFDGRSRNGDPSPATAYGCFVGIRAAVHHRLGRTSLSGVRVAIQGFGNVGRHLAELLHQDGAELWVSDIDPAKVGLAARLYGARPVSSDEIAAAEVDVLAPCALGATLDDRTVPRIRATIVAGSANNQLAERRHGAALAARGILYAPDYAINAGGIIDIASALEGYDAQAVRRRLDAIGDTLKEIFTLAERSAEPTDAIADRLAERRFRIPGRLAAVGLARTAA